MQENKHELVLKESQVDMLWGVISFIISIVLAAFLIPSQVKAVKQSPWYNSPRLFPYVLAGVLALCGISLFIQGLHKAKRANDPECAKFNLAEVKMVGITLLAMIAYTLLLSYVPIHYIILTTILMAFLMYVYGQRKLVLLILISVLLPLVIYFSFKYGLQVRFPNGL